MKCLVSFKNKNSYSCVFQPTSNIGIETGGGGVFKVRHNHKDNLFFFLVHFQFASDATVEDIK